MSLHHLRELCIADCTDPQREAITHMEGPLLVLAGPGSGKTRVITRRIAHLIAQGVAPQEILAITFTNKAAGEMRERINAMGVPGGSQVSTFHSFCARLLRMYGRHVGLEASFSIYDTADSTAAVKQAVEDLEIDTGTFPVPMLGRAISAAKNRLLTPDTLLSSSHAPEDAGTVAKVYERYNQILRNSNAADFDDLLLLTVKLLTEIADTRERLSRQYRFVLVDEYQDTNHAQYLIARSIGGHGNLCVTGDPDQSIYGWRGADISNILEFERDFPSARIVRLEQNYRSTQRILKAADALISRNMRRKSKALWTTNSEGEPVRVLHCEDEMQEADQIAAEIARLRRDHGVAARDIAIFYRINAQSRVLEKSLRGEAIPYKIVAGTEFFQRKEVKDLLAYLRLIDNPADDVAVARIANVPPRKLGDTSLDRIRQWGAERGLGLLQAMAHAGECGLRGPALQGVQSLLGVLGELRAMERRPVAKIVERLIAVTGFEKHLAALADSSEDRVENIRELINAAAEYDQAEPEGGLQGFIEQVALISDVDRWDAKQGGVTLMTLHAAKGLEFDVVFIVGLEEGLMPLVRNSEDEGDIEEERRLFFVGLTRARKRATVSCAESRARYGKREFTQPSRFLSELPAEACQEHFATRNRWQGGRAQSSFPFTKPRPAAQADFEPRRVQRSEREEIIYDDESHHEEGDFVMPAPFRVGDRVLHPTYGRGTVLGLSGYGDDLRASVQFATVGAKQLVLKYAKLRKA